MGTVRLMAQQVLSAKLVLPGGEELKIGKGVVVFVCFLKGVTEDCVRKASKSILSVKLSEVEEGAKRVNISTAEGEILVVPQATLGGKLKGSSIQYHNNVKPDEGLEFYRLFCDSFKEGRGDSGLVKEGQYGARQVLSMETNGPTVICLRFD